MVVVVAAHGLPRVPGDAQDDERDSEADQRVGDLEADGDGGGAGDDGEADVGVGAGVGAVGDQGGTVKAATSAGTNERGDPVAGEPDRSGQRKCTEVRDVLRMDEP